MPVVMSLGAAAPMLRIRFGDVGTSPVDVVLSRMTARTLGVALIAWAETGTWSASSGFSATPVAATPPLAAAPAAPPAPPPPAASAGAPPRCAACASVPALNSLRFKCEGCDIYACSDACVAHHRRRRPVRCCRRRPPLSIFTHQRLSFSGHGLSMGLWTSTGTRATVAGFRSRRPPRRLCPCPCLLPLAAG